nr:prepilin-type N-terminal cleavage/methylation domain-containing protein [uncultured Duganella sp.]
MTIPRAPRRRGGFTLIELLVAISILAIVAVLGWRGLDGIIRSRATLTAQMEQTRGLQLAFAQMQSDCANLATSALVRNRAYLQGELDRLTLVRVVMAENEPTRLQVVAYRVRDGVLTRRESNATRDLLELDALWQAALNDTDTATSVALQADVLSMGERYWINNEWRMATGLTTATPAVPGGQQGQQVQQAQQTAAPTGLEVSLALRGQDVPMIKSFLLGAL